MILVDSSVWIDLFRNVDTAPVRHLAELTDGGELVIGDLILCEVLRGARDEGAAQRIAASLGAFPVVALAGAEIAVRAAANFRQLRAIGVTPRSTIDMIIGTWCIENDVSLLHSDRDFEPMERHLGLKAVRSAATKGGLPEPRPTR